MKPILAVAAAWLVLFSSKNHVIAGSSSSGMGPWGMSNNYHRSNRRDPFSATRQRRSILSTSFLDGATATGANYYHDHKQLAIIPRGGYSNENLFSQGRAYQPSPSSTFVRVIGTIAQLFIGVGKIALPAAAGAIAAVVRFYRSLPIDAIMAQVGLVYCFLGGYYPTLFSSLQAAKYCGLHIMIDAIADLTDEAIKVIDEIEATNFWEEQHLSARELFLRKTHIVLKTVDPVKINEATGALYTTWLGVSTVLQREYARVISLSLTLAEGLERVSQIVLVPALNVLAPKDYRKWVPVVIGWTAKAMAMKVAWRMQRILTASTSSIAGGAIFARSLRNMIVKHRIERKRIQAYIDNGYSDDSDIEDEAYEEELWRDTSNPSIGENMVGFAVGSLGFYTQIECQIKNNFSFEVPFPLSLVTWPFDLAERWIQWYITNY